MKVVVPSEIDSRKVLFEKLVESLHVVPSQKHWDLKWGEPFLAVTQDRRTWVRVFYEESSAQVSAERLKHEAERLKPLLANNGELIFCLPESWGIGHKDLPVLESVVVRAWNYSGTALAISSSEVVQNFAPEASSPYSKRVLVRENGAERLTSDEVHDLAEMGLALRRLHLNQKMA